MTEERPPKRATLRWPGTRRERRLAILLPLGAAILVGGTLAILAASGGEDDSDDSSREGQSPVEAAEASLTGSLQDKRQGIGARFPAGWRRRNLRGEHVLESGDRCVAVRLSAPAPAAQAGRVREATLRALRREFETIQVAPGAPGKQVGGIPVTEDVITVPTEQGGIARILLSVGRGEKLAYLAEVLLRAPGCRRSLLEAQLILNSARFSR